MHAHDVSITLLIQSIERADERGELLSLEERRQADMLLEGDAAGSPSESLLKRAMYLGRLVEQRAPLLWGLATKQRAISSLATLCVMLLTLILGFGTHTLSSVRSFHVLSPALIGIIAWNVGSMLFLVALLAYKRLKGQPAMPLAQLDLSGLGWLKKLLLKISQWVQARLLSQGMRRDRTSEVQINALRIFQDGWGVQGSMLIWGEVRRLLHLSAITFALGAIMSAYWDGLVRSYVATAESTFMNLDGVHTLVGWILWPASLFGWPLPVMELLPSEASTLPGAIGSAAPWIHLYALSMTCWIVFPRLFLYLGETIKLKLNAMTLPASLKWLESVPTINLALAAHTNVGKTSLARTLLKRDVGEVRDEEHVTRSRASYFLIKHDEVRLRLWDTPGFGNLFKHPNQLKRLEMLAAQNDRLREKLNHKELGLSSLDREAINTLAEEADVILYMVPAYPTPDELRETKVEWQVVSLLKLPILVIINRMSEVQGRQNEQIKETQDASLSMRQRERTQFWEKEAREQFSSGLFKGVLTLDAFQRTQHQELQFYQLVTTAVSPTLRPLAELALEVWKSRYQEQLHQLSLTIAEGLVTLSRLRISAKGGLRKGREEMETVISEAVNEHAKQLHERILDGIGLKGELRQATYAFTLTVFHDSKKQRSRQKRGAIWGGLVSGLATGLGADLMAGGLSLGGGMILGGLVGALGGAGAAAGYTYFADIDGKVGLSTESLQSILNELLLFTFAASMHGRAQGVFSTPHSGDRRNQGDLEDQLQLSLVRQETFTLAINALQYINDRYGTQVEDVIAKLREEGLAENINEQLEELIKILISKGLSNIK